MDRSRLDALGRTELNSAFKALPLSPGDHVVADDIATRAWNLVNRDLDFPVMVIKASAMTANIKVFSDYCRENHVDHAPHGKTTMAPQIFARQLEAGGWAITAANIAQCRVYREFGVRRILLANVLVDRTGLEWVAAQLRSDPDVEFLCYVDSAYGVELANSVFEEAGGERPLDVLVELGYPGGRSGCRTPGEALDLIAQVNAAPQLRFRGVAGFEGLIPGDDLQDVLDRSTAYLDDIRALVDRIDDAGLFAADEELIVTAGGSSYFDLVVARLGPEAFDRPVRTVLRSGCYVTHDAEMFELTSALGARALDPAQRLEPALELWATVWSRPEPGLAIVGFGKRDAPYDYGLPLPESVRAEGGSEPRSVSGTFRITALNDQHAFMTIPPDDSLAVGDLVQLGISHPCAAFDKWRYVPLVDDEYNVVDGVFTFF